MRQRKNHIVQVMFRAFRYRLSGFLLALMLFISGVPANAASEHQDVDVYEIVFGHIEDAYEWSRKKA